jgi:hypothetical protein
MTVEVRTISHVPSRGHAAAPLWNSNGKLRVADYEDGSSIPARSQLDPSPIPARSRQAQITGDTNILFFKMPMKWGPGDAVPCEWPEIRSRHSHEDACKLALLRHLARISASPPRFGSKRSPVQIRPPRLIRRSPVTVYVAGRFLSSTRSAVRSRSTSNRSLSGSRPS